MRNWQSRLSHPLPSIVTKIINSNDLPLNNNTSTNFNCQYCKTLKSRKLFFTRKHVRSDQCFNLIFLDLWISPEKSCNDE